MASKPRLLSGMQPSAESLHLGNYVGALLSWLNLQESHEAFYMLADLHAITVPQHPAELRENSRRTVAQYIAAGIDPARSTLFVQSHVPAHAELAWVLNTITGFGEAARMTQFKDKSAKNADSTSVGLFTYPILQAGDILLYQAAEVPVGEDQRQHIELTRDLANRFNSRFGDTFAVPEPYILKSTAKLYDLQNPGSKMSKSAESKAGVIWMLDEPSVTKKKIMRAVTDADGGIVYDPENKAGVSNLLTIFSVLGGQSIASLESEFAGRGYGDLKKALADVVIEMVEPIRARTLELLDDPAELDRILAAAADRANEVAEQTLDTVYDRVGFLRRQRYRLV
ncbi:tryptophan--tRNA ligase [Subtercola boreus]|uniref:Tryptophan--tRNA ligase n=1 Tax=Subtercola boreus TaxID=120213 RepID=A0A3E0VFG1_9MICO|nr:tryptophan--tRNA ligase [Subtercola boreus]RFA08385.1 tryptophan--tRNA ligase [Subtercola boreus]TQL54704.1 tryptophanyl-tRNA synthetase [Subtercola boreus]